jgi:toluene monooxygenase system ferredoxin subunit
MFHRVCPRDELWSGEMRPCTVAGRALVLIDCEGEVSAFLDRCAHQAFPLHRGRLVGTTLTCAAHEWQYDARTGAGINPQTVALRRYPVQVRDQDIWIDIDGADRGHR